MRTGWGRNWSGEALRRSFPAKKARRRKPLYRSDLSVTIFGAHIGLANALGEMACRLAEPEPLASAAIAEFREAIRLQPDDADAHYGLADTFGRQGQREAAISEYRVAIRLRPQHPRSDSGLDGMLTGQEVWDEVVADSAAHFYLGVALRRRATDAAIAIALFREAIRLQADFADAHRMLGHVLAAQGEVEEAIAESARRSACGPMTTGPATSSATPFTAGGWWTKRPPSSARPSGSRPISLPLTPVSPPRSEPKGNSQKRYRKCAKCLISARPGRDKSSVSTLRSMRFDSPRLSSTASLSSSSWPNSTRSYRRS